MSNKRQFYFNLYKNRLVNGSNPSEVIIYANGSGLYPTLNDALQAVTANGKIIVTGGTYVNWQTTINKSVNIVAADGEIPIITYPAFTSSNLPTNLLSITSSGVRVNGINFIGARDWFRANDPQAGTSVDNFYDTVNWRVAPHCISISSQFTQTPYSIIVENCLIERGAFNGILLAGHPFTYSCPVIIQNCRFVDNGYKFNLHHGIYGSATSVYYVLIRNNFFVNSKGTGILVYESTTNNYPLNYRVNANVVLGSRYGILASGYNNSYYYNTLALNQNQFYSWRANTQNGMSEIAYNIIGKKNGYTTQDFLLDGQGSQAQWNVYDNLIGTIAGWNTSIRNGNYDFVVEYVSQNPQIPSDFILTENSIARNLVDNTLNIRLLDANNQTFPVLGIAENNLGAWD